MNGVRAFFLAIAAALLISCGGGGTPDAPSVASVAADAGQSLTPVRAFAAARTVDATSLMDWAQGRFPQFFPTPGTNGTLGPYAFRVYANGAILGLNTQTQAVVVFGGPFGSALITLGMASDFSCLVFPENCVTAAGPTLSGVAAKGLLNNATINVYNASASGAKGTLLASATTGADGRFSVTLSAAPAGPVLIEAVGGTYTSAYNGAAITSQSPLNLLLRSVASGGETGLSVNPLSDMVTARTRSYTAQGYTLSSSLDTAESWVGVQYGLKTAPGRLIPKFDVSAASTDPEGVQLALILAAFDTLGKRLSASNPDAIFGALSADFADGVFDGKSGSQQVSLNGSPLPATAGNTEFTKAFAVGFSGTAAGLRPAYLDAHFTARTIAENYQARLIPVYVASEIAPYFPSTWSAPLPNTTSFDTSASGYSCAAGVQLTTSSTGQPTCPSGETCSGGAVLITSSTGRTSCSDGGIPIYHAATIPVYTARTIVPYDAATMTSYVSATVIGSPAAGTIPVYRATEVHLLTEAERAAMMANDRAAGDAAAAKVSSLGVPTALQLDWMQRINDAVVASVRDPFLYR